MTNLWLFLILVAVALGYVSLLISISLRSLRVPIARVYLLLGELWGAFILITATLFLVTRLLGTEVSGSIADELGSRFAHWQGLTTGQQVVIAGGTLFALLLFVHTIWSWAHLRRQYEH